MLSNSDMMLAHCISRLLDLARIVAYAASQWIWNFLSWGTYVYVVVVTGFNVTENVLDILLADSFQSILHFTHKSWMAKNQ